MTKAAAMMILAGMVAAADPTYKVAICTDGANTISASYAKGAASEMFAGIGVVLKWHGVKGCPADALRVTFTENAPDTEKPGALAYALPFEGTHIVVFLNRVGRVVEPAKRAKLLAHVLVHEITHILQGTARHSNSGVMKANWVAGDYQSMAWKPLPFAPEDVEFIRFGLAARADVRGAAQLKENVE